MIWGDLIYEIAGWGRGSSFGLSFRSLNPHWALLAVLCHCKGCPTPQCRTAHAFDFSVAVALLRPRCHSPLDELERRRRPHPHARPMHVLLHISRPTTISGNSPIVPRIGLPFPAGLPCYRTFRTAALHVRWTLPNAKAPSNHPVATPKLSDPIGPQAKNTQPPILRSETVASY